MDNKKLAPQGIKKFYKLDLININNCLKVTKKMDCVINLLGVTGSPKINYSNPGSFMMSNLYCAVNLLYASQKNNVNRYLYTSTYGVYGEKSSMKEFDMWSHFPSDNDKFAGWAKRMGELQAEAYAIEYNWDKISIVRPANVYGPKDNFDPNNAMVIPSLIKKALKSKKYLHVWGDGLPVRDFIYSKDVAEGMVHMLANEQPGPINLLSLIHI